jgi:hypothetical protein
MPIIVQKTMILNTNQHLRRTRGAAPSRILLLAPLFLVIAPLSAVAQQDPVQSLNQAVRDETHDMLGFTFEERTRWEEKDGVNFGKSVNPAGYAEPSADRG